jgi:lysine 6-dehydrogenase
MNITVLGAGMVGSAIARDLAREPAFRVTAVDRAGQALGRLSSLAPVATVQADLSDSAAVTAAVSPADLVICAVPGFLGFQTLKVILQAGKNVVDISFFPEEAFLLDGLAREAGVTAVVDCGVAPGLCNIMAGHAVGLLDEAQSYSCYVGGLPVVRTWPYEYRSVFSPVDVLEEYTRPARQVEHGQEVALPALSEVELLDFPGVGTLEAFNTDGLRTLRHTLRLPSMKEKTLRYPGHANLMRVFRESGFFGAEPVEVGGQMVRPVDLTSRLLFEQWRPAGAAQQEDFTIMQVVVAGIKDGRPVVHSFHLLDRYDRATSITAMARTTGHTCAIVARQVASGLFSRRGICPPEFLGQTPGCWDDLMTGYASRGIHVEHVVSDG